MLVRRLSLLVLVVVLGALPGAAVAKRLPVSMMSPGGVVPAGTSASVWFHGTKGSSCALTARRGHTVARTRRVKVRQPVLQYGWTIPATARTGTWKVTLSCHKGSRRGTVRSALTVSNVSAGKAGHGRLFSKKLRPLQVSDRDNTVGTGKGGGGQAPFGTPLVKGTDWLGGQGVDVMSNAGCHYGCGKWNQFGMMYQCVELVERLVMTKGWGPKIPGNANQLYGQASSAYYDKHPSGSGYTPVPGDILVWGGGSKGYGHTAVVDTVTGNTINIVEQNASLSGRASLTMGPNGTVPPRWPGYPTVGILHAKANAPANAAPAPAPTPTPTPTPKPTPTPTPTPSPSPSPTPTPTPTPAPPAAPAPAVSVGKGRSAVGRPGCGNASCAYLSVSWANFGGGTHTVVCRATGQEGGFYSFSVSGAAGTVQGCYYGFANRTVWATVDGVGSNQISW